MSHRFRFLPALLALAACHPATPVDLCDVDTDQCLPCSSDTECNFVGNPCLDTVYCAQEDASVAVPEIGCTSASEYTWPDNSECRCVGTCTVHGLP